MPKWKTLLIAIAAIAALGIGYTAYLLLTHPPLAPYSHMWFPEDEAGQGGLRVTFFGNTTLLFDDGDTAIMTDGFLSRPSLWTVAVTRIGPIEERIESALARKNVDRLAAIMTAHSHYDHAMDAPVVAQKTGAVIIGSPSTAMIARGLDFPENRLRIVSGGESFTFGRFTVRVIKGLHTPGGFSMGKIEEPVSPPARFSAYREGGSFTFLIEHESRRFLVNASANVLPGSLKGIKADAVFLGIAKLGKQSEAFQENYWQQAVQGLGARRVIPIHWDNFFKPLGQPLEPLPYLADDFAASMTFLTQAAERDSVDLRLIQAFQTVDPLGGRANRP